MPAAITTVLDAQILSVTPTYTDWFTNCQFLVFQSNDTGEYVATGEFIEVAVALFAQISPGPLGSIERIINDFQDTINNIDLILLPSEFRNDCFPMRLLVNPSSAFHCPILAISC